jgi:hypothetical protein
MPLTLWSCRTRLTAPRLVWSDSNYAKHEVRRMERRQLVVKKKLLGKLG